MAAKKPPIEPEKRGRGRPRKYPLPPVPEPPKEKSNRGRKTKLRAHVWDAIRKRRLEGASFRELSEEFGISETAIIEQISAETKKIRQAVDKFRQGDVILDQLSFSAQALANNLLNSLRATSMHLAGAAKIGAATAHRTAVLANERVERLDSNELDHNVLRDVAALTAVSNEAAKIGLNLLNANKEQALIADENVRTKQTLADFYGDAPRLTEE